MSPGRQRKIEETPATKKKFDHEFEKRLFLAQREASHNVFLVKAWGILTTLGAISSIALLLWFIFKKS